MATIFYQVMSLGKLFAALEEAAIREHDAWVSDKPLSHQQKWSNTEARIKKEIRTRGNEAVQRYIQLLTHRHPRVRLSAALAIQEYASELTTLVLDELRTGPYTLAITLPAEMHYNALRQRNILPRD